MSEKHFPETPEAVAFALFNQVLEADPSLTSRASDQPVATYMIWADLATTAGQQGGDALPRQEGGSLSR